MAKYPIGLLEEELKNKVAADWLGGLGQTALPGFGGGMPHAENAEGAEESPEDGCHACSWADIEKTESI